MNDTVKKVMKISFLTAAVIAGALLIKKQTSWAAGLLIGTVWCVLNYIFTIKVFEAALLQKEPKKVGASLMIKFPVLYLIGFLILMSKQFPTMSLLAGIGVVLLVIGAVSLWPKRA